MKKTTCIWGVSEDSENPGNNLIMFCNGMYGLLTAPHFIDRIDYENYNEEVLPKIRISSKRKQYSKPILERLYIIRGDKIIPQLMHTEEDIMKVTAYVDESGKLRATISLQPVAAQCLMCEAYGEDWEADDIGSDGVEITWTNPVTEEAESIRAYCKNAFSDNKTCRDMALVKAAARLFVGNDIYRENFVINDADAVIRKNADGRLICDTKYSLCNSEYDEKGIMTKTYIRNDETGKIVKCIDFNGSEDGNKSELKIKNREL